MSHQHRHKEIHIKLDPSQMRYWVDAEFDIGRASTEEEEARIKDIAWQQLNEALQPHLEQGWAIDDDDAVSFERRLVGKEGNIFSHEHYAAIVGAWVRLKRVR